ncbi:hypothetical protein EJB05_24805, partial [Eragrostis curvula]
MMAAPPRTPRLLELVWLVMALLLAATTGCHCKPVPYGPIDVPIVGTFRTSDAPPPPSMHSAINCRNGRCHGQP